MWRVQDQEKEMLPRTAGITGASMELKSTRLSKIVDVWSLMLQRFAVLIVVEII